jgi:hypothetical protein
MKDPSCYVYCLTVPTPVAPQEIFLSAVDRYQALPPVGLSSLIRLDNLSTTGKELLESVWKYRYITRHMRHMF